MANTTVDQAVYALRYDPGNSAQLLDAARKSAEEAARAGDKLAVSEENVSRATLRLLASVDQKSKVDLRAADQLEKINRLYVDGRATADQYARAVTGIEQNYNKAIGAGNQFGTALGMIRNLAGAFGVTLGAIGLVNFIRDAITSTAAIDDLAQTIGLTTDELQAYRAAALDAGASTSIADEAIKKYTRSVGEAEGGNKKMADAFRDLGLDAADLAGGPTASLPKVIEALNEIESVTERARLETILFGRAGQQIEQVLGAWGTEADKLIARYKELGLIIDEDTIRRFDRASAEAEKFWMRMKTGTVEWIAALSAAPGWMNPWNLALDPNSPKLQEFANSQTTAMGLGNSLPFAGKDSLQIAATGKKFGDEVKAEQEEAAKEAKRLLKQQESDIIQFWKDVAQVEENAYERKVKEGADYWKEVDRIRDRDLAELDDFHKRALEAEEGYYERVRKEAEDYWGSVDKLRDAEGKKYERALEKKRDDTERVFDDMLDVGFDFFADLADRGEGSFKRLLNNMRSWWMDLMFDLARQQIKLGGGVGGGGVTSLFGSTGMFGGGAFGGQAGQIGWAGGALSGAAMIGGMLQDPNGNTRITSGLSGAASGAMMGSMILPGIGTAIGAVVGAIAGMIAGSDKPSDMRSVATFGANGNFKVAAQSAHESSDQTLSLADQAAKAIQMEMQSLQAFGVELTQKLSNIWIGARDQSTFQLVGGQRVSVGSVGNAQDLAGDTVAALLKGATSSDPEIQKILSAGGSGSEVLKSLQGLQAARSFSEEIEKAILQIEDPLKAAIELWKKESQARLDMAIQSGVSTDKVIKLNELLYKQITATVNAQSISGLQGLIGSLKYGPLSTASPQSQFDAGLAAFEKAKAAALSDPSQANVQAFLSQTQSFLPSARSHLASSKAYTDIESGALSSAELLLQKVQQGSAVPDIGPTIAAASASNASVISASVEAVEDQVAGLREEVRGLGVTFAAIAARVSGQS